MKLTPQLSSPKVVAIKQSLMDSPLLDCSGDIPAPVRLGLAHCSLARVLRAHQEGLAAIIQVETAKQARDEEEKKAAETVRYAYNLSSYLEVSLLARVHCFGVQCCIIFHLCACA